MEVEGHVSAGGGEQGVAPGSHDHAQVRFHLGRPVATRSITTGGTGSAVKEVAGTETVAKVEDKELEVPTIHQEVNPDSGCRPAGTEDKSALECGDVVTIGATGPSFVASDASGAVKLAAGVCSGAGLFKLHCEHRSDGHDLQYGDRVFFRHVATGRLLEDGATHDAEYTHQTLEVPTGLSLGLEKGKPPQRHNLFTVFSPAGINVRSQVNPKDELVFRNRFARYLAATTDGKVVSDVFDLKNAPDAGLFRLVSQEGPDVGCADGTREGFLDRNKSPNIAGCAAKWSKSLSRCPPGNIGTRNGLYACSACSVGWHVCGIPKNSIAAANPDCSNSVGGYDPTEVSRHACLDDCRSQAGFFASASPFAAYKGGDCSVSGVSPSFVAPAAEEEPSAAPTPATTPPPSVSDDGSPIPIPPTPTPTPKPTPAPLVRSSPLAGCGSATGRYAPSNDFGKDCTGFAELAGKSCASGRPGGKLSNLLCPATTIYGCDANEDEGTPDSYRGVLCCRDNAQPTPLPKCSPVGVPENQRLDEKDVQESFAADKDEEAAMAQVGTIISK